jgi:hypothetical protein
MAARATTIFLKGQNEAARGMTTVYIDAKRICRKVGITLKVINPFDKKKVWLHLNMAVIRRVKFGATS